MGGGGGRTRSVPGTWDSQGRGLEADKHRTDKPQTPVALPGALLPDQETFPWLTSEQNGKHGTRRERLISKTQGRKINTQLIEQIKKYSKLVDVNSHRPIIK